MRNKYMNPQTVGLAQAVGMPFLGEIPEHVTTLQNAMLNQHCASEIPAVHSSLESHMGELQAEINQLSHQIDKLEKALEHVLIPTYPAPTCEPVTKEPVPVRSNLIGGLVARRNEIQGLSLKLYRIAIRVQL